MTERADPTLDRLWSSMSHAAPHSARVDPTDGTKSRGGTTKQAGHAALSNIAAGGAAGDDGSTEQTVLGVRIVAPAGVAPTTIDLCAEYVRAEVGRNVFAQRRLARIHAVIVIIPANTAMTALPQFASLAGGTTFDGRHWEDVRGSGGTQIGNEFAVAIGEETLVNVPTSYERYPLTYSVGMHEFAHLLMTKRWTRPQEHRIHALYTARQQAQTAAGGNWQGLFTDAYASRNEQEYWAQCTNCFFGRNEHVGQNGRDWLQAHDPDMYDLCVEMYEREHDARGDLVSASGP